jgi:hypothetical protein
MDGVLSENWDVCYSSSILTIMPDLIQAKGSKSSLGTKKMAGVAS